MAAFALFLSMTGICYGTTIGFVGAAGVNANIPADYGSNANANGTGWTTLDGSGATPDVGLTWNGASSDWEFHNSSTFNPIEAETAGGTWDANPANAVAQLQGPQHLEINFSVTTGVRLILNSFDIGNATDQSEPAYGWNVSLVKDSDSSTGWTHSTALFTAGEVETVTANFTGEWGEDYTLNFDRNPAGTPSFRSGIDNLSFSQDPAPNTTIIGFVGAAGVNANIPSNYCSNVTGDGTGWISSGTPEIGLTWYAAGSDWEFHDSGAFTPIETNTVGGAWDASPSNAVAQLQASAHLEIKFSVTSEVGLVLNSFDIGNATDQIEAPYGWNISLVKDSDSSTGWTHSTALFTAGDVEHVIANAAGDLGEDYTLNFDRSAGSTSHRTGLDNLSFSSTTVTKPPVITNGPTISIGHRGASLLAPENTLAAFAACLNKSDMVEFDVHESSDGELVVIHDSTVDRTTDGTGSVSSITLAELETLDAGSWYSSDFAGEKIPTLTETLNAIVPDRIPLIEHKAGSAANYVQVLQNLNMTTSVVVQSFNWSFLDSVHALDPSIELAALGSGALNQSLINNLKSRGINTIAWANGSITATEVFLVHTNGMRLFVYTVNGVIIQNFINMGVDGVISDDPGLVYDLSDDSYSNFMQMKENIISYWMFNDGPASTVAIDSVGSNPGTLNGFETPPSWTSSMNPQFDGALYLDGINNYVNIPNSASLNINTNSLSMSLWVKLPVKPSQISGSYGAIFDSTSDAYVIYLDKASAQLRFKLTDINEDAARPGIPEAYIETGTWHNIVIVFDGSAGPVAGQALIYWDGRLMDIHTGKDESKTGLDGNVKLDQHAAIGRNGTTASSYQSFTVDDFAIWNRRLRSGEARQIFNSGTNGIPLSNLLVPEPAILGLLIFLCLMFVRRR